MVVAGALLPPEIASAMARSIDTTRLTTWLGRARPTREFIGGELGAPHWSWLARTFGMDADPPVTAPYAFGQNPQTPSPGHTAWIAHCEPVFLALGRDHMVLRDLAQAPLQTQEAQTLFTLAGQVLAQECDSHVPKGGDPLLHLEQSLGQWYLRSNEDVDLRCAPPDAVMGRYLHEYLPSGRHARYFKILGNEIQMLWHTSSVNSERESQGLVPVNAVWIHGGGRWQPLPPTRITHVAVAPQGAEEAILHGWLQAAQAPLHAPAPGADPMRAPESELGDALTLYKGLMPSFAFQEWQEWFAGLPALEAQIEQEINQARQRGAACFELVLCGQHMGRVLEFRLEPRWWQSLLGVRRASPATVQRFFQESNVARPRDTLA